LLSEHKEQATPFVMEKKKRIAAPVEEVYQSQIPLASIFKKSYDLCTF
jgi:hypothetical protein